VYAMEVRPGPTGFNIKTAILADCGYNI